jgi:hypothetical protein
MQKLSCNAVGKFIYTYKRKLQFWDIGFTTFSYCIDCKLLVWRRILFCNTTSGVTVGVINCTIPINGTVQLTKVGKLVQVSTSSVLTGH